MQHLKNLQLIAPYTVTILARNSNHYILSCTFFVIAGHVDGLTTWKTRRFCDWNWRSPQCERIYCESFSTCWNKHCVCTVKKSLLRTWCLTYIIFMFLMLLCFLWLLLLLFLFQYGLKIILLLCLLFFFYSWSLC